MKRLLVVWLVALLFGLSLACAERTVAPKYVPAVQPAAPLADEWLMLSAPRRDYLLGEPVLLNLAFRNLGKETIHVHHIVVEPGRYRAPLWIARNGEDFQEFKPEITTDCGRPQRVLAVAPGDSLKCEYRAVCAPWRPAFRLAFPKPGDYRVYVVYPLGIVGAKDNSHRASNIVEVRITEPVREDATVWKELNNPSSLTFLQLDEELTEKHKDIALQLAELLAAHPKSGYAPSLRHALSKVSSRFHASLSFDQTVQFSEIVNLKGFIWVEDDPKDKRLDMIRKDSLNKETTLAHVLATLSKESGVSLDAPLELKTTPVGIPDFLTTVRDAMRILRRVDASWDRRGDGYFLMPFNANEAPEPKKVP